MDEVIWIFDKSRGEKINLIIDHLSKDEDSPLMDLGFLDKFKSDLNHIIDQIVAIVNSPQFNWQGKAYFISSILPRVDMDDHIFLYKISVDGGFGGFGKNLPQQPIINAQTSYYLRLTLIDCTDYIRLNKINKII